MQVTCHLCSVLRFFLTLKKKADAQPQAHSKYILGILGNLLYI